MPTISGPTPAHERPMQVPATTADPDPTNATTPAPDWDHVPFDVGCARCGRDLRGLTEPMCPDCALEFDWSDAVPIEHITCAQCDYHLYGAQESRCPECGTKFDWNDALDRYRRMQRFLFEYRWRDRPLRSFVRTWRLQLRPMRFWRGLELHDPVQVVPLAATSVVLLGLCWASAPISIGFGNAATWVLTELLQRGPSWQLLTWLGNVVGWAIDDGWLDAAIICAAVWSLASLAALMIFRQSMRRYRVRSVHVFRAWAYAVPTLLPAIGFTSALISVVSYWLLPSFRRSGAEVVIPLLLLLIHVMWSTRCAFGVYMKMDRAWGIALASQVIAVLATIVYCLLFLPDRLLGDLVWWLQGRW